MEIKKEMEVSTETLLYLFLLNMGLLNPGDRSKIVRIIDTLVGLPIEREYEKT